MWEGLGGPVPIGRQASNNNTTTNDNTDDDNDDNDNMDMIDPTLDACCRREMESQQHAAQVRAALQRHDVVAARERQRRNLIPLYGYYAATAAVAASSAAATVTAAAAAAAAAAASSAADNQREGCRCSFDPNRDGGEYRALMELRAARQQRQKQQQQEEEAVADDEDEDEDVDDKEAYAKSKITTTALINHASKHNNTSHNNNSDDNNHNDDDDDDDDEFDYLLNEDLSGPNSELFLAAFEERRRAELEYAMLQHEMALQHGYGIHCQMHPTRILQAAGLLMMMTTTMMNKDSTSPPPPAAVVMHLVDPDSTASASLDLYLEELALTTRGTKFMRSGGRAVLLLMNNNNNSNNNWINQKGVCIPQRRRLLLLDPERDLPALIAIRDGVVVNICPRLEGLMDSSSSSSLNRESIIQPDAVHQWLDRSGVLLLDPPPLATMCRIRPEEEALTMTSPLVAVANSRTREEEDEQQQQRYNCGVEGCYKTFRHEHVGVQTEQQQGLVVSEEQVLGGKE